MTDIDDPIIAQINGALAGRTYNRSTTAFLSPPRHTVLWPALIAVALAVGALSGVLLLTSNAHNTVYGWSPTPRAATAAERATARRVCDLTITIAPTGDGGVSFSDTRNYSDTPSMELDTLDIRGDVYLATLHNAQASSVCQVTDLNSNPRIVAQTAVGLPAGTTLAAAATTALSPDIAIITGGTPAAAATVEIDVPNLPTIHAAVHATLFATWIPANNFHDKATIRAYDINGQLIATTNNLQIDPHGP